MVYTTDVQIILLYDKIDNMSKINEILTAVILYCIISYVLSLNNLELGILFAILGSHINVLLPKNYKHTLLTFIPLIPVFYYYPLVSIALMTGYFSSILIALLSKDGCKLLYPVKSTTFTGPSNYLENNTRRDYAATTFLITLMLISLIFSFNGMQIIDTLSHENIFSLNDSDYKMNNSAYPVHYININPAYCVNKNITTFSQENRTTTLITNYSPS